MLGFPKKADSKSKIDNEQVVDKDENFEDQISEQLKNLQQILPGTWQVQLGIPTPLGVMPGQILIEIHSNGSFQGQTPGMMLEGQWSISPSLQLILSGMQSNGMQIAPYQTAIQFTQLSQNRLDGFTSANEVATWNRAG